MSNPVVLELASLPREQVGPFLLLGLPKEAIKEEIEENWADRIKWARKNAIKVPLEDINWAREMLSDVERRIRADAASLNAETSDGILTRLAQRYGTLGNGRMWQPLDQEKPLADYVPSVEVPDVEELRTSITLPPTPEELPAAVLLERLASIPLDPWRIDLPTSQDQAP
jgi:hypothetical protein